MFARPLDASAGGLFIVRSYIIYGVIGQVAAKKATGVKKCGFHVRDASG
ncbi:hypothetical protein [Thermodesulfitimonas sp.]